MASRFPHTHTLTLTLWRSGTLATARSAAAALLQRRASVQCCTMLVASVWQPSAGDQCCASLVAQWRTVLELPQHSDTHCRRSCMRHSCVRGRLQIGPEAPPRSRWPTGRLYTHDLSLSPSRSRAPALDLSHLSTVISLLCPLLVWNQV